MPKLNQIIIKNYRSIKGPIVINFTKNTPVVLIGENNTGKTNILRAIDLIFGEYHPKYKKLEDHDFYGRNIYENYEICIEVNIYGLETCLGRFDEHKCVGFKFTGKNDNNNELSAVQENGKEYKYVSNELREELSTVFVSSEQNLSYQLSYSSKYTLLSKVTRAFHQKLTSDEKRVKKLKELFKSIKDIFYEVNEFKQFKDNMSNIADEMIKNMTHGLELDFSAYDPSNYFRSLRVHPSEDGEIRSFDELGTGQQQILALSFAHAYAKSFLGKGLILLIDEPETHLHPLAQKWLAKTMFEMTKGGLQLVITTHNPNFINLEYLEGLYLVRKDENGTYVINTDAKSLCKYCVENGSHPEKTKEETIIPFYSAHATENILRGLFANKVVLVEGLTEELALPIYFMKVGLDTLKEGVDIINVGGKGNLAKWWRFFTKFEIPTFICFDNDGKKDDEKGNKRRDALKTIGIPESEIEDVLTVEDWNINDNFCVFGKNFEDTMRNSFSEYREIESEKKEQLGDSKPIIAREVARSMNFNGSEIGWERFKDLSGKIKKLEIKV